jgi:hypothetical protein
VLLSGAVSTAGGEGSRYSTWKRSENIVMQTILRRLRESLRFLLCGSVDLARAPAWLQEKFQDEFEWQDKFAESQQPYTYPSQDLLRAGESPETGERVLLRPARGAGGDDGGQLLRPDASEKET